LAAASPGKSGTQFQDVVFAAVAHPVKTEEDSLAQLSGLILKSHFQAPFHIVDKWLQRFLQ
jgi:hypothetical protein